MRFGETVWHSSRLNEPNAEISEFSAPKAIRTRANYFSVMPATSRGFLEVMQYGEDIDSTWTAIASQRCFGDLYGFVLDDSSLGGKNIFSTEKILKKIKVGDLFWLDGEKPPEETTEDYGYAESATAVVKSVSFVDHTISITLTRNKEQVKQ